MRGRFELTPSLVASAVLHGTIAVLLLMYWPHEPVPPAPPLTFGDPVPVNIVAGPGSLRPVEEDVVKQEATVADPVPDVKPTPPAPTPAPLPPSFVVPSKPTKAPVKPLPTPGKAQPVEDDFERQTQSALNSHAKPGGSPSTSGPRGPTTHAATDIRPHPGTGADLTQSETADLATPLFKVWAANCYALGANRVDVTITVIIKANGYFDGNPTAVPGTNMSDAFTRAAVTRAIAALKQVEPFKVPSRFSAVTMSFHFDPRKMC